MLRYLPAVALLLVLPAAAQAPAERLRSETEPPALAQASPGLDANGCLDLAAKLDADAKAKRKSPPSEEEAIDGCVKRLNCDRVRQAADAEKVPEAAYADYETTLRYVLKECGHTGYKPELTPGEKFMREKP